MRSFFTVIFLCAFAVSALAATGVIDQEGNSSFSACYLTPEDPSVCNYAILYKGLQVEVIGGSASSRWKVRVPVGDSKVVVADGWQGRPDSEGVGWVSPRFVKTQNSPAVNSGTVTFMGENVSGGVDNSVTVTDNGGLQDNTPITHGLSFLGQNTPGDPSVTNSNSTGDGTNVAVDSGEGVYYVFAGMGEDQEYFFQIAQNGPISGKPNYVWRSIRRDVSETGARCRGVVVVKVASPDDIYVVLKNGMVPSGGPTALPSGDQRVPIYAVNQLTASNFKIIGFATVSHSGQDGPLVDYGSDKGKQFHARYLAADYLNHRRGAQTTVYRRMINRPRFTFCGCNIGHCQYYDGENPSFSHWVASIYVSKGAVVRGKYTVGSPNASESQFATFGRQGNGPVIRMSPGKKEYKMLIKVPTNRYDQYNVPFSSTEERDAILAYYKERNVTVNVSGNNVVVRSPSWLRGKWMDRQTDKDDLLDALLKAMATRDIRTARYGDTFQSWMARNTTVSLEKAKKMMPRLEALFNDPKLQRRIELVKMDNGGNLDIHDFRLWSYIYFGNLTQEQLRENRWSLPLRACLCADEGNTKAFLGN